MKTKILALCLVAATIFAACENEKPVTPSNNKATRTYVAAATSEYNFQIYYDLENNTGVAIDKYTWDLALQSNDAGVLVLLNPGKNMLGYNTYKTNFDSTYAWDSNVDNKSQIAPTYNDDAEGDTSKNVFSHIQSHIGQVFVLSLGTKKSVKLGYKKVQILAANASSYTIKVGELNATGGTTLKIDKNTALYHTCIKLSDLSTVNVEPNKDNWDLVFTTYKDTATAFNTKLNYDLQGVLSGKEVSVSELNGVNWDNIDLAYANGLSYSKAKNTIGYDWKTNTSFMNEKDYVIRKDRIYIVKLNNGKLFKLRFLDFYNDNKESGYTKFETKEL